MKTCMYAHNKTHDMFVLLVRTKTRGVQCGLTSLGFLISSVDQLFNVWPTNHQSLRPNQTKSNRTEPNQTESNRKKRNETKRVQALLQGTKNGTIYLRFTLI